ncbi:type I restriction-modification system subunit M [Bifidobacterium catulorum]|uniref:site-specific DNA-methyltransferase (adenine-specific) n=1 Tax=Bifidobacterium catulorum TaxID=1630173 RepID=A0A2U2MQ09_9BIFI|nr:class I SAM-dependent DNA methyltransferase [Bifidobacterium catulorum]PWG58933.1 DNA methyltransferase [Bifidobacterium catulorum]
MLSSEVRNRIDRVWDAFWSGGISNPLEVIEQITYLLFLRRLDMNQQREENKARRLKRPIVHAIYAEEQRDLRWHVFIEQDPQTMFATVSDRVFPFLRTMGGERSSYAEQMKDARFTIPTPVLLAKVVELVDAIPLDNTDTNGDLYEYLLSKLASSGVNGQFRTPRHIIQLMVRMVAPAPDDRICDPACGTAGFLVAASEYMREHHPQVLSDPDLRARYGTDMFHGYDFDHTMLRIGSMNLMLHGIENPNVHYKDSLSEAGDEDEDRYSLILANPPFSGSLDYETTSAKLLKRVKTKKTELLFLAHFLRMLRPGGRAAVIVPEGVLFGSTTAHKKLRKALVEEQRLDAVVKLPSGVFKPYAGVSTAILVFTKTDAGGTDDVWFYDVHADGFSLDDKRNPVDANDLPDVLARWPHRGESSERNRPRTAQSFVVPKKEIAEQDYDLSLNRYKEIEYEEEEHREPAEILADIDALNTSIAADVTALRDLLR